MFRGDMTQRNVHKMAPQWARKFGGGGFMPNISDFNANARKLVQDIPMCF
jgi:hypothetical protein